MTKRTVIQHDFRHRPGTMSTYGGSAVAFVSW